MSAVEERVQKAISSVPIPGEGLTDKLGAFAWQRPPTLNTVDEAMMFYSDKLTEKNTTDVIAASLDAGQSVRTIAQTFMDLGIYQGIHSIDVAYLISPILVEMIMYIGDSNNISYTTGFEDQDKNPILEKIMLEKTIAKFNKTDIKNNNTTEEVEPAIMPVESKGLMSRPTTIEGEV